MQLFLELQQIVAVKSNLMTKILKKFEAKILNLIVSFGRYIMVQFKSVFKKNLTILLFTNH